MRRTWWNPFFPLWVYLFCSHFQFQLQSRKNIKLERRKEKNLISFIVKHFFLLLRLGFFFLPFSVSQITVTLMQIFGRMDFVVYWEMCFRPSHCLLVVGHHQNDKIWSFSATTISDRTSFAAQDEENIFFLLFCNERPLCLFVCLFVCLLAFVPALSNTMSPNDDDPFLTLSVFFNIFFCCCQSQFLPASLTIILMYDYFYFSLVPLTFQQDIMSSKLPSFPLFHFHLKHTHSFYLFSPQFLCLSFCI